MEKCRTKRHLARPITCIYRLPQRLLPVLKPAGRKLRSILRRTTLCQNTHHCDIQPPGQHRKQNSLFRSKTTTKYEGTVNCEHLLHVPGSKTNSDGAVGGQERMNPPGQEGFAAQQPGTPVDQPRSLCFQALQNELVQMSSRGATGLLVNERRRREEGTLFIPTAIY